MDKKTTILVIEDHNDMRENIAEILELSHFEVITAAEGKEGVKLAREHLPDLILCDVMMPGLDGYGVLHLLNQDPNTEGIPFIFLTAKAEKTDFRKGMNLGADDYLSKPFEELDLLHAIEMRLKKKSRMKLPENSQFLFDQLIENAQEKVFKAKETVFREGDFLHHLYFLESGRIKCTRLNESGKQYLTQLVEAGGLLGLKALIKKEKAMETATCLEDCRLKLIGKDSFLSQIDISDSLSQTLTQQLASDLENAHAKLLALAYDSVRKRVADALLKWKNALHEASEISREDLAAQAGTSVESVIRTLSEFKKDGIIVIVHGKIKINQADALKAIRY